MNWVERDNILAKSREENNGADLVEKELDKRISSIVSVAVTALALLFSIMRRISGNGQHYGYNVILMCPMLIQMIVRFWYTRKRFYAVLTAFVGLFAVWFTVLFVLQTFGHDV